MISPVGDSNPLINPAVSKPEADARRPLEANNKDEEQSSGPIRSFDNSERDNSGLIGVSTEDKSAKLLSSGKAEDGGQGRVGLLKQSEQQPVPLLKSTSDLDDGQTALLSTYDKAGNLLQPQAEQATVDLIG